MQKQVVFFLENMPNNLQDNIYVKDHNFLEEKTIILEI